MTGRRGRAARKPPPGARLERALVAALGSALPAHFRARQRAEWEADLAELALDGRPATRWRYLLAAARTLPTLRAVARHARVDGPGALPTPATPTARTLAWVTATSLGWTLLSWAVVIAGPYLALDVPARLAAGVESDPKGMWPIGDPALPLPLRIALALGCYAATGMDILLLGVTGMVALCLVLSAPRPDRQRALERSVVIGTAALALMVADAFASLTFPFTGLALTVTGITAAALAVGRSGLPARWRIVLGALAAAGIAVVITDNTVGTDMIVWFRD
ncbi:hypothetical protein ACFFWC_22500 [Plantactinospora siamensis]|uniref:Uncharacterized protein n=1 Tax=Plantactinospora siamensis TaxID=555372 RepID=A0ABV6NYH5_9ACTN